MSNTTDMSLFKGNSIVNAELFESLQALNKLLTGGAGDTKRISIKGGRFREIIGGEQVNVSTEPFLNVVIVNAAPMSRTYYTSTYDPDNVGPPSCWSLDTRVPAPDVPADQRQAESCANCPMNVKGSGQGDNKRACRFNQRLAVTLEGKPSEVYQLQLPATSLFGDPVGDRLPMQAYAKLLHSHKTPIIAVVTQMYFDLDVESPKLYFKPIRPLAEAELKLALEAKDSPDAIAAITYTVSTPAKAADGEKPAAKAETAKPAATKAAAAEDVPEPTKAATAKSEVPTEAKSMADLLADWDDA